MKGINKSIDKYCRVLRPSAAKMMDCHLLSIPVSKCADLQPSATAHISDLRPLMYLTKLNFVLTSKFVTFSGLKHTNS